MSSEDVYNDAKVDASITNVNTFMRNISELMDKLDVIQKKIGPLDLSYKQPGLKGALLKLFEACCPLSRNSTDEQLWLEHQKIRSLLADENIPNSSHINGRLSSRNRKDAINSMLDWCSKNGADISKLSVQASGSDSQFMIKAAEDIQAHEPFFSIPNNTVIFSDDFLTHEAISHLASKDPVLSTMHTVLLAYGILLKFYEDTDGFYWPYLYSLPEKYENASYFEFEELESLRCSVSFRDALNEWKGVVRQYSYLHLKIIEYAQSQDERLSGPVKQLKLDELFCYEDYRWAAATVRSRTHTINSPTSSVGYNLVLIPALDLCNHGDTISSVNYDPVDKICRASCGIEVKKDSEIFLFYGARTNSQMLYHYGFFLENNCHNFIIYRIPFEPDNNLNEEKHQLLLKLGMSEHNGVPISLTSDVTWSGDLMAYMRIYVANDEDISLLKEVPEAELRKKLFDSIALNQLNEDEALSKIIDELQKTLTGYEASKDFNVDTEDKSLSFNMRCILKLKNSEYEILKSVVTKLLEFQSSPQPKIS